MKPDFKRRSDTWRHKSKGRSWRQTSVRKRLCFRNSVSLRLRIRESRKKDSLKLRGRSRQNLSVKSLRRKKGRDWRR